jgi:hypothetical protein
VVGLIGHRESGRQAQRSDLDLIFQFGDRPLDAGQTDLVVEQRSTLLQENAAPLLVSLLLPLLLRQLRADVPFVTAGADGLLIGDYQL